MIDSLLNNIEKTKVSKIHKKLGRLMWDHVGMARNEQGLKNVLTHFNNTVVSLLS